MSSIILVNSHIGLKLQFFSSGNSKHSALMEDVQNILQKMVVIMQQVRLSWCIIKLRYIIIIFIILLFFMQGNHQMIILSSLPFTIILISILLIILFISQRKKPKKHAVFLLRKLLPANRYQIRWAPKPCQA